MNLPALSSSITDTAMDMVPSLGEISASLLRPFNVSTFKLGNSGENKRVWLQTRYLERIGLEKNSPIDIDFSKEARQITISKVDVGNHRVSGRANGLPIIDVKNKQVAETLGQNVEKNHRALLSEPRHYHHRRIFVRS